MPGTRRSASARPATIAAASCGARPDAADADQLLEQPQLVGRAEPVQGEGILADVEVGVQGGRLARAHLGGRRNAGEDADAADADDHPAFAGLLDHAAQARYRHVRSLHMLERV